jgi:hypothetical protein
MPYFPLSSRFLSWSAKADHQKLDADPHLKVVDGLPAPPAPTMTQDSGISARGRSLVTEVP